MDAPIQQRQQSVSSRVRDYLEQWAHEHRDEQFTAWDIQVGLQLEGVHAVSATISRFAHEKVIRAVGKKTPPRGGRPKFVYVVEDEHLAIKTRLTAPKPHNRIGGRGPHKDTGRDLPLLEDQLTEFTKKSLVPSVDAPVRSLIEMVLDLGVAIERTERNPDLTKCDTDKLLAEIQRRGFKVASA